MMIDIVRRTNTEKLLADSEFCGWLTKARPGDVLEYHRGFLAADVDAGKARLPEHDRAELIRLRRRAYWAFEIGRAHLVQRRHGPGDYSYFVVARPRPKTLVRVDVVAPARGGRAMMPSTTSFCIPEEKSSPIPNRLTLEAVPTTPLSKIAAISAAQLAMLQQEAIKALAKAKHLKDWLDNGIDLKYRDHAAALRRSSGKDTGAVRIKDGEVVVIVDLPKRVKWEQARLAEIVERIRAGGDDPAEYGTVEFAVSERAYGAWPQDIRAAFGPARTVETGKPSYRFKSIKGGA